MVNATLHEIIQEVQRVTGRNDPDWTSRIESAVRRAYRAWESEFAWRDLRFVDEITFYGNDPYLILPQDVEQVVWMIDATNYNEIEASDGQWDRRDPWAVAKDYRTYAYEWEPVGYRPFSTLVSTATLTVEYVVSGALPTHTKILQVRGYWQLSGATLANQKYEAVQQYAVTTMSAVSTFALNAVLIDGLAANLVTAQTCPVVLKTPDGSVVGIIPPGRLESEYYWVRLFNMPQNGTKIKYGAIRRVAPVTHFSLYADAVLPGADPEYLLWQAAADIFSELKEAEWAVYALKRANAAMRRQREKEVLFGDHASRIIPEDNT